MSSEEINLTRVIISKDGKLLLENKTIPFVEIQIKGNVGLHLFEEKPVNLHDLEISDFEIYWRKKYKHDIKECGEKTIKVEERWTKWKEYPKNKIFFQDRTRNKSNGG